MRAEINKDIELVQVLLYLSDVQDKTRQSTNNKNYCNDISRHFQPYNNHFAVLLTRELVNTKYFFHIRPLRAILNIENLVNDKNNELHEWALAVKQFIYDTDFNAFFESQSKYYKWILKSIDNCNFDKWIGFIEHYFKQKPDVFKLIICPIAGNYGFTMKTSQSITAYTVRSMPYYDNGGNAEWYFDFFAKGIAHEYAHCFINPVVETNIELLEKHKSFFAQHTNMFDSYNVDYAVMNEYWVRAFAIRFMEYNKDLFPDFDILEEYKRQRECFIYIDNFVELLKGFEKSILSFTDFYLNNIKCIDSFAK